MSKELECLKRIDMKIYITEREHRDFYSVVEQALQRLESIDNSNPSEALNGLEFICKILNEKRIDVKWLFKNEYTTIKQALLKAQKEHKALEIIKEKNVNIGLVKVLGSVEQYNQTYVYDNMLNVKWCLTEEEFDLLKEVLW